MTDKSIVGELVKSVIQQESTGGGGEDFIPEIIAVNQGVYDIDTSMTLAYPSEAQIGDLIVLVGFLRGSLVAPTTGWTSLVQSTESGTGSVGTTLHVLHRFYNGSDVDVTFEGSTSDRMSVCMAVIRGENLTISTPVVQDAPQKVAEQHEYIMPSVINNSGSARLCIQALTNAYTSNNTNATICTGTIGGVGTTNIHRPITSSYLSSFSHCRLAAIGFRVEAGEQKEAELDFFSVNLRTAPTLPHCYFFVGADAP
ncbi:hypothetical protein NVP1015O_07 [Vibrio phage 1.015.O._10N.222.51.E5]|nr:hypothetical protein NVP1015O_07 [Vibrio phage 1.015.O._10N.222.51.E5]